MYYLRRKAYDSGIIYFKDVVRSTRTTPTAKDARSAWWSRTRRSSTRRTRADAVHALRTSYPGDREVGRRYASGVPAMPPPAKPDSAQPAAASRRRHRHALRRAPRDLRRELRSAAPRPSAPRRRRVEALGLDASCSFPRRCSRSRRARATAAPTAPRHGALLSAAIPGFAADAIEIERAGLSYTVDTLAALAARWPGAELFCSWARTCRSSSNGGSRSESGAGESWCWCGAETRRRLAASRARDELLQSRRVDISSTEMRARVRRGQVHSRVRAGRRRRLHRGGSAVPIEDSMIKRVITRSSGRVTIASARKSSRSSTRSTSTRRGCQVSEEELRAQTAKFREIIRERTGALEARAAELREPKRAATDPAEREKIDTELSGPTAAAAPRPSFATRSPRCSTRSCPRRSPRCAKACRRLVGTTVDGHGPRARVGHGALRRAAHGRHPATPRQDRRDGDGRRQDARRDAAALPECAAGKGRAPRHGELVPRPPRLAVDGTPLQLPRPHGRLPR